MLRMLCYICELYVIFVNGMLCCECYVILRIVCYVVIIMLCCECYVANVMLRIVCYIATIMVYV